jgi:hypothetical protein
MTSKCELEGCRMPCEKMPPCAKSEARLQKWLRKWKTERFLYDTDGNLVGIADADSLAGEIEAALSGKQPPRRKKR